MKKYGKDGGRGRKSISCSSFSLSVSLSHRGSTLPLPRPNTCATCYCYSRKLFATDLSSILSYRNGTKRGCARHPLKSRCQTIVIPFYVYASMLRYM